MAPPADRLARLDALPRRGWVVEPTPVEPLPDLAAELGLASLTVKRDDAIESLWGGTKVRKLDHLLAEPPWADAIGWCSVGAIGSGHLSTLAAAAAKLSRHFEATIFWEPADARVLQDLAYTASQATSLRYVPSRTRLALRHGGLLWRKRRHGLAVVPAGATAPAGMAGLVRAGLELAAQVEAGQLPPPDRIVVPLGTGGTVAGLRAGLALAGLTPTVHAVAAVERLLSGRGRLRRLQRRLGRWLVDRGVAGADQLELPPLAIDRSQLGRGYGVPTAESLRAAETLAELGLDLEPIYSGKAMAALLPGGARKGEHVLFWLTPRRAGPLPAADDWQDRLPEALALRLTPEGRRRLTRRRFIKVGAAVGVAAVTAYRLTGHGDYPGGWSGQALSEREANVVRACAECLLPPAPDAGTTYDQVAANVDAYMLGMPSHLARDVGLLLFGIDQATTVLDARLPRLTRLDPPEREAFLTTLAHRGGLQGQMYRGIRDLVMMGYYQQRVGWDAMGYHGPLVGEARRPAPGYDQLRAGKAALPKAFVHDRTGRGA